MSKKKKVLKRKRKTKVEVQPRFNLRLWLRGKGPRVS